jgi:GDPmannose 4,6-dehydratase
MLQQTTPDDYVIATGRCARFARCAPLRSRTPVSTWCHVVIDPAVPASEVDILHGNAARPRPSAEPTTRFEEMISEMVDADLRRLGARPRLPRITRSQRQRAAQRSAGASTPQMRLPA